jgi:hypothetical protein
MSYFGLEWILVKNAIPIKIRCCKPLVPHSTGRSLPTSKRRSFGMDSKTTFSKHIVKSNILLSEIGPKPSESKQSIATFMIGGKSVVRKLSRFT